MRDSDERIDIEPTKEEDLLVMILDIASVFNEDLESWDYDDPLARKWLRRNFKKQTGISAEFFRDRLSLIGDIADSKGIDNFGRFREDFRILLDYYLYIQSVSKANCPDSQNVIQNPKKLDEWIIELRQIIAILGEETV